MVVRGSACWPAAPHIMLVTGVPWRCRPPMCVIDYRNRTRGWNGTWAVVTWRGPTTLSAEPLADWVSSALWGGS